MDEVSIEGMFMMRKLKAIHRYEYAGLLPSTQTPEPGKEKPNHPPQVGPRKSEKEKIKAKIRKRPKKSHLGIVSVACWAQPEVGDFVSVV